MRLFNRRFLLVTFRHEDLDPIVKLSFSWEMRLLPFEPRRLRSDKGDIALEVLR